MLQKKLTLINKRGLHARAATRLVQVCKEFDAQVQVFFGAKQAAGKNIMQLLMLAAPLGTELEFQVTGPEAKAALTAIEQLIEQRFDEED